MASRCGLLALSLVTTAVPLCLGGQAVSGDVAALRAYRLAFPGAEARVALQRKWLKAHTKDLKEFDSRMWDPASTWTPPERVRGHNEPTRGNFSAYLGMAVACLESGEPHLERVGEKIVNALATRPRWRKHFADEYVHHYGLIQLLCAYLKRAHTWKEESRRNLLGALADGLKPYPWESARCNVDSVGPVRQALVANVAGKLVGDERMLNYGAKQIDLMLSSANAGVVFEKSVPGGYGIIMLDTLSQLTSFAPDWPIAVKCMLLEETYLWRNAARFHPATYRVAGPFVYATTQSGAQGLHPESRMSMMNKMLAPGEMWPPFHYTGAHTIQGEFGFTDTIAALARKGCGAPPGKVPPPRLGMPGFTVRTRTSASVPEPGPDKHSAEGPRYRAVDCVSFLTREYALGSMAEPRFLDENTRGRHWPVVLTFRTNGKMGFKRLTVRCSTQGPLDFKTRPDSGKHPELVHTLQDGGRLIAVYDTHRWISSASHERLSTKVQVYEFSDGALEQVWIDDPAKGRRGSAPVLWRAPFREEVKPGQVVLVRDTDTFIAIWPLAPHNFGRREAVRLERKDGWFVLRMITYEGPKRTFSKDELRKNNRCAFAMEVGDKTQFESFDAFRDHVNRVAISDKRSVDADGWPTRAITYVAPKKRMRMVYSAREQKAVVREVDGGEPPSYVFDSDMAKRRDDGRGQVGHATVTAQPAVPLYLAVDQARQVYAILKLDTTPSTVTLQTPAGRLVANGFPQGKIVLRPQGTPALEVFTYTPAKVRLSAKLAPGAKLLWNLRAASAVRTDQGWIVEPD